MSKNILFDNSKELISLFLTKGDKISWPREIKIAKKLLTQFPDIDFWRQYDPGTRFHSLSIFLTKHIQKDLEKEYSLFLLTKPKEEIKLEEKPIIKIELKEKSKTLQEFIDS